MIASITQESSIHWPILIVQIVNLLVVIGLYLLSAKSILAKGKGWEVPAWLVLCFCVPVVLPVIALIHFRTTRFNSAKA